MIPAQVAPQRFEYATTSGMIVHCENRRTWLIVINLAVTLVYNVSLFILAFTVLWRQRKVNAHGLWRTLRIQGVIWLCSCSAVLIPALIVVAININGKLFYRSLNGFD